MNTLSLDPDGNGVAIPNFGRQGQRGEGEPDSPGLLPEAQPPSSQAMKVRIEVSQDHAQDKDEAHQGAGQDHFRPSSRTKNRTALLKKNPLDPSMAEIAQHLDPKLYMNMDLRDIKNLRYGPMVEG